MTPTGKYLAFAAAAILVIVGALFGLDSCHKRQGEAAETEAAIHTGEANAHANAAQAIKDHAAERAQAASDVAGARAEVVRLRKLLAAKPIIPVSDPNDTTPPVIVPLPIDPRDVVIAAQDVLITKLDGQVSTLTLALTDETRRSTEFQAAFEAERRATTAQAVATKAWKQSVTSSKWVGRFQGFAAGVAVGYVAGARR